jgi:hypothetical protein
MCCVDQLNPHLKAVIDERPFLAGYRRDVIGVLRAWS